MSILLVACQFEYRTPNRVNKNIEVQYSTNCVIISTIGTDLYCTRHELCCALYKPGPRGGTIIVYLLVPKEKRIYFHV
jgi:hypothetical protein